jgi:hypothetical protein
MRRAFHHLLLVLAFLGGFALAAGALSRVIEPPRVPTVNTKLDWLAAHHAQYDVLVFGSSRMRQIVPSILDTDLAAAGINVRTFNAAVDGMRPPEDGYMLDRAMETRTTPLRLLFMEANPVALRISEDDENTTKVLYWHDNRRMWTIWRRAWSHSIKRPPWLGKWISDTWRNVRFAAVHAQYWVKNSVRVGRGSELLFEWLGLPVPPEIVRGLGVAKDGYIPPDDVTPMDASELRGYNAALTKLLRLGRQLDFMDATSQRELHRAADIARQHGARLVIVAPPSTTVEVLEPQLSPGSDIIFLDFSDPRQYPELFKPEVRLNGGHLNAEGSQLFTRLIARELAAALRKSPGGSDAR